MSVTQRLFIVGPPRTGTTLLQSLVLSSGLFVSGPETHFLPKLSRKRGLKGVYHNWSAYRHLSQWRQQAAFRNHPPSFTTLSGGLRSFQELWDSETGDYGLQRWVEKTPRHLHYVPLIRYHVPKALFLFTTREAAAAAASLAEARTAWQPYKYSADEVGRALARWASDNALIASYYDPDDSLIINYDRLVSAPDEAAHHLGTWLGLPEGNHPTIANLSRIAPTIINYQESWKHRNRTDYIRPSSKVPNDDLVLNVQRFHHLVCNPNHDLP